MGGWLRVAITFIKRRAAAVMSGCDKEVHDDLVTMMIREAIARVHQENSVRGKWYIDSSKLDLWVDTSLLVTRVSLKNNGATMEDTS